MLQRSYNFYYEVVYYASLLISLSFWIFFSFFYFYCELMDESCFNLTKIMIKIDIIWKRTWDLWYILSSWKWRKLPCWKGVRGEKGLRSISASLIWIIFNKSRSNLQFFSSLTIKNYSSLFLNRPAMSTNIYRR